MRILIVGGDGMLGHELLRQWNPRHDVRATVRKDSSYSSEIRRDQFFLNVDVRSMETLGKCISAFQPNVIVNAAGIVKQRALAKEVLPSLEVNSVFPHRLALMAREQGAKVVHISTDCVFSGRDGNYSEDSVPDPVDLYGRTKLLGELDYPHCVTLRTSIVGREVFNKEALLEWFLAQSGTVKGFTRAIYSGLSTTELARVIETLVCSHPDASGVWHVSSAPISKFELLLLFREYFKKTNHIVPDDSFVCDRSLDSARFRSRFRYAPPSWDAMVEEMARERSYA